MEPIRSDALIVARSVVADSQNSVRLRQSQPQQDEIIPPDRDHLVRIVTIDDMPYIIQPQNV